MEITAMVQKAKQGELTFKDLKETILNEIEILESIYEEDDVMPELMNAISFSGEEIQELVNDTGRIAILFPHNDED